MNTKPNNKTGRLVPLALTLLMTAAATLASCGGNTGSRPMLQEVDTTTVTGQADDTQTVPADPEVIETRVKFIYEKVGEAYPEINDIPPSNDSLDLAFCTGQWQTLVEMVNEKDASEGEMGSAGFFTADYWIMGQDWGKISASDISVDIKDDTHADVTLLLHNLGTTTKVKLQMIFERGEWLIDDFIDQTNQMDWKQSMMQYLEQKKEDTSDDIQVYDIP